MTLDPELRGALVSLLLGLLLGLERERSQRAPEVLFAGIRTFPLLTLAGYLGALAGTHGFQFVFPAVLLAVGALGVAAYVRSSDQHAGVTTEALALLAPLLGGLVVWGGVEPAAALTVLVTLLLTLKAPLHRVAGSVSEDEILAILKFAVVAVVVLPILPNTAFGPFDAIVPRRVGVVVVVLTGVGLLGYLLVRLFGSRSGWALAGALGGLVSSTSVTLGFSGRARRGGEQGASLSLGIVLASTVLYARSLVLILAFDRSLGTALAVPLGLLFVIGAVLAVWRFRSLRGGSSVVELGNPVELGAAVGLALLFTAILVVAHAAQAWLGTGGLWVVALAGGLVDVDAVALALAGMHREGLASTGAASGAYLLATAANLLVKGIIVASVGGREFARTILPVFALWVLVTVGFVAWFV